MPVKVKALGWYMGWFMIPLLAVAGLAASSGDLRLADAVAKGDKEAVRSLLKAHADVNASQADGATVLAVSVYRDDLETTDLLIGAGANVNAANDFGITPLSLACTNGNAAVVETLLKAGANPNTTQLTGETALMTCAHRGNLDAVKSLLTHGADVNGKETRRGQTALMWAVAERHRDVARELIAHGADVHAKTAPAAWQFATYGDGVQETSQGGYTPLLFAAQQGDQDTVQMLLAAGSQVNETAADGMTPLLMASACGYEGLALFLLDKNADAKAADGNGVSVLHYAVQRGLATIGGGGGRAGDKANMRELVKALLAHGADPNVRLRKPPLRMRLVGEPRMDPDGATPFLLAAATSDLPLMHLLLAAGANPNLNTNDNTTPLMAAAGIAGGGRKTKEQEKNILEAVKLLVELGNDVNAVNTNEERTINGRTAIHAATYQAMDSVIQFLAEKGAKVDVADRCGETPLNIALGDPAGLRYSTERIRGGYKSTAELLRKLGGDVAIVPPDVTCVNLAAIHSRYTSQIKLVEAPKPGAK